MRSLVIILSSAFLLLAAFGVYWWVHDPVGGPTLQAPEAGRTGLPSAPPARAPDGGIINNVSEGWMEHYDRKTARLLSRITAERSYPMADGRLKVARPRAEFFLGNGQVVRIVGRDGIITMREELAHNNSDIQTPGVNRSPHRGLMHEVTLTLYESIKATRPTLTLTMPNTSFDNESLRIATEPYEDPQKQKIAADQVPVTVRGDDYEFDGRGMELRWNERDGRLDSLRIAHGQRLLVKHARALMGDAMPKVALRAMPEMLASADRAAVADALSRPETAERQAPLYRAMFYDAVKIRQGTQLLATSDQMQIDFRQPADSATTRPATLPADDAQALPAPATRPTTRRVATTRPSRAPTTQHAATQPAATQPIDEESLEVTWTGPLVISPLQDQVVDRVETGQAVVRLTGKPVTVTREASLVRCAALTYWTADKTLLLEEGPGTLLEMIDGAGPDAMKLQTTRMTISQLKHQASLEGRSSATLPLRRGDKDAGAARGAPGGESAKATAEFMTANWTEHCQIAFTDGPDGQFVVNRADLRGNVAVRHPQLVLKSRELQLDFAEPQAAATRPTGADAVASANGQPRTMLRQLEATDDVHCEMLDPAQQRRIDCRHLKLLTGATPDGRLYARNLIADGTVHALDEQFDLRSEYLSVSLNPTTRPATQSPAAEHGDAMAAAELQALVAHDNVRVAMKDGATASGEQLLIESRDGKPSIKLLGQALVTQGESSLSGPIVQFVPDSQFVNVLGPGRMKAVQQPADGGSARPIEVTWRTSMTASGQTNEVDCLGDAKATTLEPDGTVEVATAERIKLILVDNPRPRPRPQTQPSTLPADELAEAPMTRPSTRPADEVADASTTRPATRPSKRAMMDAMGDKAVREVHLLEAGVVNAELFGADGQLLKRMDLKSEAIRVNVPERRLNIALPGTLLIEDHRAPTTRPASGSEESSDFRGQTAIAWEKQLLYDETARHAVLDGQVRIVWQEEGENGKRWQLRGERFTAALAPAAETRPADGTPAPAAPRAAARVQSIHGEGGIVFTGPDLWFEAPVVEYDAENGILTARSVERQRVRLIETAGDREGLEKGACDELQWNVRTQQLQRMKNFNATLRK